jgi:dTDP-4-amino-4,6-dideoxygalactose transaminase
MHQTAIPFFRPDIGDPEIEEVVAALRSGWLTTGPRVQRFEREFAAAVGARAAVAVNSCTAALHLAVDALALKPGQGVLVPTMTFAATAEVVRYMGAIPVLVDCDPVTMNLDLADAERQLDAVQAGHHLGSLPRGSAVVGLAPVHVGGLMMDMEAVAGFAARRNLWVVEDAAHAFPAAWRAAAGDPWQRCGEATSNITCFSFYANKTMTTGEGGMAVTSDARLADRMRLMSLHGLSQDAWGRYSGGGSWDYKIIAPGFKYNLTDIAAAIGLHQLARAETMRLKRERIARRYLAAFGDLEELDLPADAPDRIHSWHLFPIKLRLPRLSIGRNAFIEALRAAGVACSVHWRPLHLHPYYQQTFGYRPGDLPVASALFERIVSLPIFSTMTESEVEHVVTSVRMTVQANAWPLARTGAA